MGAESFIAATDSAQMQGGGTSIFDDVTDALTKGVAGAVVSGWNGIYNTGVDFSNKFLGTDADRADTLATLDSIDQGYGEYYKQHQQVIDTAGFFAGSIVPGGLAVKGLKAISVAGESAGVFSRVLGYAAKRETFYLNEALKDLSVEGGTVFQRIQGNKLAAMAWGTADQTLQVAAYETATALSMKSSPMLDSEDWKDIAWDVTKTSLIGGAIGGGLQAIFTNKIVKDAGKLVEGKQRMYDVLNNIGNTDLTFGDKAYQIIDALAKLPEEIADPVVKLTHGKKELLPSLDLSGLLDKTLQKTIRDGVQKFDATLQHVVENDKTVGAALAKSLVGVYKEAVETGADMDFVRQRLGDLLFNLKSVAGINGKPTTAAEKIVWFDPEAKVSQKVALSERKGSDKSIPYRVISDEEPKIAVLGKDAQTFDDAFARGFDVVIEPGTKTMLVNNRSAVYQKITPGEANTASVFYNTVLQQTMDDAVATIGDAGGDLKVNINGVSNGKKTFQFRTGTFDQPPTAMEATARHLWAEDSFVPLEDVKGSGTGHIGGSIENRDVSLLDALLKNPDAAEPNLIVVDTTAHTAGKWSDIVNKEAYVFQQKYNRAIELLEQAGDKADLRDIAYKLNVSEGWLDKAVSTRFSTKELFQDPGWKQSARRFADRENLILSYTKTGMDDASKNFPEGLVAYYQRVAEATSRGKDAAAAVLGEDTSKLVNLRSSLAGKATSQDVGAGFFKASNAGYSDALAAWAQYTGSQVRQIINNRTSTVLASFQSPAAKWLQGSKEAQMELVAAVTQGRLSTEPLAIYTDALSGKRMLVDLPSYEKILSGGKIEFEKRIELTPEAGELIQSWHTLHRFAVDQQNVLAAAQGYQTHWNPNQLYFPPIDTKRVPFFAFVRQTDGSVFGSSEVAMITARDASELQRLAAAVEQKPGFQVIYKRDTEEFYKAKREYDFGRTMNSPVIDSTLRKEGLLGDHLPNFTPEAMLEDMTNFILRRETKLVRDAVTVNYGQTFAELNDLSSRYSAAQTSKFEGLSKLLQRGTSDPFKDAVNLALDISKRSEFPLWNEANEFVDALGTRAFRAVEKAAIDARRGQISWEDANATLEKFGIRAPFPDDTAFQVAQHANDRSLIKVALQKANAILAAGMLRLDWANAMLNTISTPILLGTEVSAIRNSLKNDPELFAQLNSKLTVAVPGVVDPTTKLPVTIPSTAKLLFDAVADLVSDRGKELMTRFREIGTVKGPAALYHQMVEDLSLTPKLIPTDYAKKVEAWVEKGATLTGNNLAEDYTRFVTSHVMWNITKPLVEAGRMTEQEANAFISIFTNRVQGNYIASQRPIVFQGTLGAAIGLFQTYQFNLLQQLYRHIENKDLKTLAVMGGLQGTLFGANGLPFFQAVNTQIVGNASINAKHEDAYSYAVKAAGKEWGDWLMYGTASAFPLFSEQAPALWTRGDLNPRGTFVLPTSPTDIPAVQATMKVVGAVFGMAKQVSKGADIKDALLFGLEHNGINRPLAGLAQVLSGQSTTSQGNLISSAGDWNSIATFSRLVGAKPMDESVALTTMYRSEAYQAVDKQRIDDLASVIKQKLRNNQAISSEDWTDLQGQYAAAGGRIQGFTQAVRRWDKAANTSVVNEVMRHSQTAAGQRMIEVMGGDPLRDYRNQLGQSPGETE